MVRENTNTRQTTLSPNVALLFCQYETSTTSKKSNQFPLLQKNTPTRKKPANTPKRIIPNNVSVNKKTQDFSAAGTGDKQKEKREVNSSPLLLPTTPLPKSMNNNSRQLPNMNTRKKQQNQGKKPTSNSGRPQSGYKAAKSKTISESTTTTTCHSDSNSSTTTASSSSRRHTENRRPQVNIAKLIAPNSTDPYSAYLSSVARPLQTSSRRNRTSNSFSNTNFQKVHSSNNYCNNNNNRSNFPRYKNVKNTADFFAGMAAAPEATALPQPPQAWLDKRSERIAAKLKYNGLEPVVGRLFDSFKGSNLVSISA